MPLYDYYCSHCGRCWEAFNKIDIRREEICKCGKIASIGIALTSRPVIYEYYSENLNTQITGPAQKRKIMKAMGMEETG